MSVVYLLKDGSEGISDTSRLEWQYTDDEGFCNYDAIGRAIWGNEFSRVAFSTGQPRRAVANQDGFCRYIESEPDAVMKIYFHYESGQPWAMVAKVWPNPAARDDWRNQEKTGLLFYIWGANAQLPVALR